MCLLFGGVSIRGKGLDYICDICAKNWLQGELTESRAKTRLAATAVCSRADALEIWSQYFWLVSCRVTRSLQSVSDCSPQYIYIYIYQDFIIYSTSRCLRAWFSNVDVQNWIQNRRTWWVKQHFPLHEFGQIEKAPHRQPRKKDPLPQVPSLLERIGWCDEFAYLWWSLLNVHLTTKIYQNPLRRRDRMCQDVTNNMVLTCTDCWLLMWADIITGLWFLWA